MPIKLSLVLDNTNINIKKHNFYNYNDIFLQKYKSNNVVNNNFINEIASPSGNKTISMDLNSPMISRVYKAKSGCSACGK